MRNRIFVGRGSGICRRLLQIPSRVDDWISRMTLKERIDQLGHIAPGLPRLRVPACNWWNDGLHGVTPATPVRME